MAVVFRCRNQTDDVHDPRRRELRARQVRKDFPAH